LTPAVAKEIVKADKGSYSMEMILTAANVIVKENVALVEGINIIETELRKKDERVRALGISITVKDTCLDNVIVLEGSQSPSYDPEEVTAMLEAARKA